MLHRPWFRLDCKHITGFLYRPKMQRIKPVCNVVIIILWLIWIRQLWFQDKTSLNVRTSTCIACNTICRENGNIVARFDHLLYKRYLSYDVYMITNMPKFHIPLLIRVVKKSKKLSIRNHMYILCPERPIMLISRCWSLIVFFFTKRSVFNTGLFKSGHQENDPPTTLPWSIWPEIVKPWLIVNAVSYGNWSAMSLVGVVWFTTKIAIDGNIWRDL